MLLDAGLAVMLRHGSRQEARPKLVGSILQVWGCQSRPMLLPQVSVRAGFRWLYGTQTPACILDRSCSRLPGVSGVRYTKTVCRSSKACLLQAISPAVLPDASGQLLPCKVLAAGSGTPGVDGASLHPSPAKRRRADGLQVRYACCHPFIGL